MERVHIYLFLQAVFICGCAGLIAHSWGLAFSDPSVYLSYGPRSSSALLWSPVVVLYLAYALCAIASRKSRLALGAGALCLGLAIGVFIYSAFVPGPAGIYGAGQSPPVPNSVLGASFAVIAVLAAHWPSIALARKVDLRTPRFRRAIDMFWFRTIPYVAGLVAVALCSVFVIARVCVILLMLKTPGSGIDTIEWDVAILWASVLAPYLAFAICFVLAKDSRIVLRLWWLCLPLSAGVAVYGALASIAGDPEPWNDPDLRIPALVWDASVAALVSCALYPLLVFLGRDIARHDQGFIRRIDYWLAMALPFTLLCGLVMLMQFFWAGTLWTPVLEGGILSFGAASIAARLLILGSALYVLLSSPSRKLLARAFLLVIACLVVDFAALFALDE